MSDTAVDVTSEAPVAPVSPGLRRSAPASLGVPAAAVEAVLDALEAQSLEMHSLMVVRHGQVAAEGWWAPYSPERVHLLYSLSKSFTSTAVGFCVAEGRFTLDDRVVDLLPDHVPADVDPQVATWTVHHLLSMSTGHLEDTLDRAWSRQPYDLVRGFLELPPDVAVGSRHAYNNATTYVLAAIVERHTATPLLDYLRPRLLDPLGITAARWDTDERGQALGFSGLHLQTEAIAVFGQLLLQDGIWRGDGLLPEGWVELATGVHITNDDDPERPVDWRQGYGYQYWMARHGFRGDGAYGQFCVVVPELDLVVAATACVVDMQPVLDVLWTHLLPALDQPGPSGDEGMVADARLHDRLASLALPVVRVPADAADPTTHLRDAVFTVAGPPSDRAVEPAALRPGTTLTVTTAPGADDLTLTVDLGGTGETVLTLSCASGHWAEGSLTAIGSATSTRGVRPPTPTPVVCRGGWVDDDEFEADLVLIETPHRFRLRGHGSALTTVWNAAPLAGPDLASHLPGVPLGAA